MTKKNLSKLYIELLTQKKRFIMTKLRDEK